MSSDIAIKVENLSKCYQIYDAPRDRLKQFILPKVQSVLGLQRKQYFKEFWALKDVSFEVKKGETVGIIGRNGSGKSTMLQMICGTLSPTSGSIKTNGRIAALLELGSGFNPEFTGRENVYLNASVLGLSKEEIDARFDEIERFADIGDFIGQPVKTYSSGMLVRLAFAVIAHVDADILVIDEALAVGDAFFTQKCMRFIRKFMSNGTLLFVSHDIGAVINLCEKVLWLDSGAKLMLGGAKNTSEKYLEWSLGNSYGTEVKLKSMEHQVPEDFIEQPKELIDIAPLSLSGNAAPQIEIKENIKDAAGWMTGAGEILTVELVEKNGSMPANWLGGESVEIKIKAIARADLNQPILGFLVRDRLGQDLFGENTLSLTDSAPFAVKGGDEFEATFKFILPLLPNGQYSVMASLANGDFINHIQHHWMHDALLINVNSSKVRWGLVGLAFDDVSLKKSK